LVVGNKQERDNDIVTLNHHFLDDFTVVSYKSKVTGTLNELTLKHLIKRVALRVLKFLICRSTQYNLSHDSQIAKPKQQTLNTQKQSNHSIALSSQ